MRSPALPCLLACLLCSVGAATGCASRSAPVTVFSEQDARVVLEPLRFGWLSSERETGELPSAIALGAKTSGRLLLYLEFPALDQPRRLLRAQLLLSPGTGGTDRVAIEVSRAEPARGELRTWADQPRALYPRAPGQVSANAGPARVDVTEILRVAPKRGEPLRLLLRAEPGEGEGVLITTGASGGDVPRLELYFQ